MGITTDLAAYCANLRLQDLPPEVVARTRQLVLDLVGNIVRGRHDAESTPALLAACRALGFAGGSCGVFGDADSYTPVFTLWGKKFGLTLGDKMVASARALLARPGVQRAVTTQQLKFDL